MRAIDTEEGVAYPINLGDLFEFTILELAEKVIKLTARKSKLVLTLQNIGNPILPYLNTILIHHLNREPKDNLDSGLKETISYFRKQLND